MEFPHHLRVLHLLPDPARVHSLCLDFHALHSNLSLAMPCDRVRGELRRLGARNVWELGCQSVLQKALSYLYPASSIHACLLDASERAERAYNQARATPAFRDAHARGKPGSKQCKLEPGSTVFGGTMHRSYCICLFDDLSRTIHWADHADGTKRLTFWQLNGSTA